jgi:hypothetical protein
MRAAVRLYQRPPLRGVADSQSVSLAFTALDGIEKFLRITVVMDVYNACLHDGLA